MDWDKAHTPARRVDPPAPTIVEGCWRLQFGKRVVACGIYRDAAPGLEVRAGFSDDDLLKSERVPEIGAARELADAWRLEVVAKGGVEDSSGPS